MSLGAGVVYSLFFQSRADEALDYETTRADEGSVTRRRGFWETQPQSTF